MGYFGGLGAGKGWLKFLFVVDPDVLREVLIAIKPVLVITNSRVPADYDATPLNEYLAAPQKKVPGIRSSLRPWG
jgi:hypothetical protein